MTKILCFQWEGQLHQFTCLANGLSSAPRKFTKLLNVPLSQLHKGHISLVHLDDFYLQSKSFQQCLENIVDTVSLFSRLGLVVHPVKSGFIPSQMIAILGFTLNSLNMTVIGVWAGGHSPPPKFLRSGRNPCVIRAKHKKF